MERNFCGIQYMACPIDDKEGNTWVKKIKRVSVLILCS